MTEFKHFRSPWHFAMCSWVPYFNILCNWPRWCVLDATISHVFEFWRYCGCLMEQTIMTVHIEARCNVQTQIFEIMELLIRLFYIELKNNDMAAVRKLSLSSDSKAVAQHITVNILIIWSAWQERHKLRRLTLWFLELLYILTFNDTELHNHTP